MFTEIRKQYFILLSHKGYELFTNEKSYGFYKTFNQAYKKMEALKNER